VLVQTLNHAQSICDIAQIPYSQPRLKLLPVLRAILVLPNAHVCQK